ncbi:MAG: class I SAM-dependent methyltransferase [Phycisphaerae bacterium]
MQALALEHWSAGNADDNMDEGILTTLAGLVAQHPWWAVRGQMALELVRRHVPPPAAVADVGCGWGTNLGLLADAGYEVSGFDVSSRVLHRLARQRDLPVRRLVECDLTQPLPDDHATFDAVLALDVIEHIDDDYAAVLRLAELTRPGGVALVSVPALPELFSEFDEVQGHRRRYTPEALREAFTGSGLEVVWLNFWGASMVKLLGRQRSRRRAGPGESAEDTYARYLNLPPWPGPVVLRWLLQFDAARTLGGPVPTGTSLMALARKSG